ncbi:hypothetical protein VTN00DRAFT_6380 [Thermoascus crustaceus]|uniref:uncharacterized protein n=1 Tax=Thermoascus crustaceus TaxID=5088 RepID=UPI0037442C5C
MQDGEDGAAIEGEGAAGGGRQEFWLEGKAGLGRTTAGPSPVATYRTVSYAVSVTGTDHLHANGRRRGSARCTTVESDGSRLAVIRPIGHVVVRSGRSPSLLVADRLTTVDLDPIHDPSRSSAHPTSLVKAEPVATVVALEERDVVGR